MGMQPSLDGLRAVSVIAVLCYHAGFGWMAGGFLGVEVFFVVSGFLITALLIAERDRRGSVSLRRFWGRRARRLLPALLTMLSAVVFVVLWRGDRLQLTQLRRDLPWGLAYAANWGQILSDVAYFAPSPAALRHLWSLAVEEQWYLVWPIAFIAIGRRADHDRRTGIAVAAIALAVMTATGVASLTGWPRHLFDPLRSTVRSVDAINVLYLSTPTRASGLLLGAALAFIWRPWAQPDGAAPGEPRTVRRRLDLAATLAITVLLMLFVIGEVTASITYRIWLPLTSVMSTVLVAVAVHPSATATRRALGSRPLAAIGRRSYGMYLWSWPISLAVGAHQGSWLRFAGAMALTVPVSEACYRWIELPVRNRSFDRRVAALPARRRTWIGIGAVTIALAATTATVAQLARADPVYDAARDTEASEVFDLGATMASTTATVAPAPQAAAQLAPFTPPQPSADTSTTRVPAASTTASSTTVPPPPAPPVTLASLPRRMVIVGDSTAHSMAVNLPAGLSDYFRIEDGSIDGCSVYSDGVAVSGASFRRPFDGCSGWERRWLKDAQRIDAEVALVVIGAWDVLDVRVGDQTLAFASQQFDDRFSAGLQSGIDILTAAGVHVALLEIPCMRPREAKGAGTPPLPERGDDVRVGHLNQLLRNLAAINPTSTTFINGPPEYCKDDVIATDSKYRWDGVHASGKGVNLTFAAIALPLLQIELAQPVQYVGLALHTAEHQRDAFVAGDLLPHLEQARQTCRPGVRDVDAGGPTR